MARHRRFQVTATVGGSALGAVVQLGQAVLVEVSGDYAGPVAGQKTGVRVRVFYRTSTPNQMIFNPAATDDTTHHNFKATQTVPTPVRGTYTIRVHAWDDTNRKTAAGQCRTRAIRFTVQ